MKLEPFFAVPVATVKFAGADELNGELARLFVEREGLGGAYRNPKRLDTQHGRLFESRFDLFTWPESVVKRLVDACHGSLSQLVKGVNQYSDEEFARLSFEYHSWYHVTRDGGFQGLHDHPNASWSGIYCVDPGDAMEGRPDNGQVRFHDPRSIHMYKDAANDRLMQPYFVGTFNVNHEAGRLLLFPSYLKHEIFPYHGERPRIVVAFNCWVRQRKN